MGWLSKLFNLDLWTEQNLGAVPNPVPQENQKEEITKSKADAKNRLKLVLMHDRTQLSSEVLEKMRGEIVEVISKYVEIDKDALEINLESESNTIALVANIPMMKVRAAQGKGQEGKAESQGSDGAQSEEANTKGKVEEESKKEEETVDDLIEAVEASEKAEDKPAKKAGQ